MCVCVTVKAFLAQAKEEFSKKWDEPAQVSSSLTAVIAVLVCAWSAFCSHAVICVSFIRNWSCCIVLDLGS